MTQEAEQGEGTAGTISHQLTKQINLPFYDDYEGESVDTRKTGVVTDTVESYVRGVRLQCTGVAHSVKRFNQSVSSKYNTAKAHSLGVVDFFQSEPELWQRCGIVAAAGLTGVIAAYRRPTMIKARNLMLSSGVAAAICWPQQTVEAGKLSYNYVKEPTLNLWDEYSPWSQNRPVTTAVITPTEFYTNKVNVAEDHGQSQVEDKDMYSTRGS